MDNVELSLALGRSYSSITGRKHTLKISPEKRLWTPEEVSKLKQLTQEGMTDREIAKALNRTRNSVLEKRIEEGMNKRKKLKKYKIYCVQKRK